jgi:isoquinoline 1-oxidoreductase beta subunit
MKRASSVTRLRLTWSCVATRFRTVDTYDSMRIAQMPKVESIIMPSGGNTPWGGVGEPTICVAAPAVLNAYFKATDKRIRSFPLKNQNIVLI